jgi:hypothetical protein
LGKNVIKLLKQKVAQKIDIILGYFIFSKNLNEPPKVAQFGEKSPNLVTLPRPGQNVIKNVSVIYELL